MTPLASAEPMDNLLLDPATKSHSTPNAVDVQVSADQHLLDIDCKVRTSVLPWKGQFSPQLVEYLISKNAPPNSFIVDPFCGSGTVLYEAARQGHSALGLDINPAAVVLSEVASICAMTSAVRDDVLKHLETFSSQLLAHLSNCNSLAANQAANLLAGYDSVQSTKSILTAFLTLSFGDGHTVNIKSMERAKKIIVKTLRDAPFGDGIIRSLIGDARDFHLLDSSVDYILTSPPYINVFNYHQNYRPITEALGYLPLNSARAEIGANRKFRMNRYITVVQYCIDISLFLIEAARVLKQGRPLTIVLGRESNVRGVSFKNGDLVAKIISDGNQGRIVQWNERWFMNRFGARICEDVITVVPYSRPKAIAAEVGRAVGRQALTNALSYAPQERHEEIEQALNAGLTVTNSPYVLKDAQ